MAWEQISPPEELALDFNLVKAHLRQIDTSEDEYIRMLVQAATEVVESKTNRAFINRPIRYTRQGWPCHRDSLELPVHPVSDITSVKFFDTSGSVSTWDSSRYFIGKANVGYIAPVNGELWPYLYNYDNEITVEYIAGYGDTHESVPPSVKAAIMYLVGHFFANREPIVVGTAILANKVPFTLQYILNTLRIPMVI